MRVKVGTISSISHVLMENGTPCDKYVATVKVLRLGRNVLSRVHYLRVYGRTELAVERKLKQYRTDQPMDVSKQELYDQKGCLHGTARYKVS
nr:MAG TPA: hypothetical protein [Caudoviricetes sp.]